MGAITFKREYYAYVGSAINNIEKRIARYKRTEKKLRYYIDHLLEQGKIIDIKMIETRKECGLSYEIKKKAAYSIAKFGSSNCKCRSHLQYFIENSIEKLK